MENKLEIIVKESGLEQSKANFILEKFQDSFKIAAEWEERAKTIIVTDATQKVEMQLARTGRLFLREKRLEIEKSRKELKEQALREGKAIDGIANVLKALIVPIEEYLDKQEHFVELKIKAEEEAVILLAQEKIRLEIEAKEKAETEEREKQRIENIRLKKENDLKEKELAAEKLKSENERKALEEKSRFERERAAAEKLKLENELKKKSEIEKKLKLENERIKIEQEQKDKEKIECPFCHKKFNLK